MDDVSDEALNALLKRYKVCLAFGVLRFMSCMKGGCSSGTKRVEGSRKRSDSEEGVQGCCEGIFQGFLMFVLLFSQAV